jgi:phosphatidylserine decarboxylase
MIHKEGYPTLILLFVLSLAGGLFVNIFKPSLLIFFLIVMGVFFLFFLNFFRNPTRKIPALSDGKVYAPADGKVVVIENTLEQEFFKDERLQISIFMSPLNVHVNRNPISGIISYNKYHKGKYLAAWNPKSSTENERNTTVVKGPKGEILFRQIAGALARRIVSYVKKGDQVIQGEDMGFIKLGSRVDIFLPVGTKVNVKLDDFVYGATDVIAEL